MYLLCKEEMENTKNSSLDNTDVKEEVLYHATSPTNAYSIARYNIDWRKTWRTRFGIGACFSPSPEYANRYASVRGGT